MSTDKIINTTLLTIFLFLIALPSARAAVPKITKVQVTESSMASQVEIVADAPVTYTYYTIPTPPRAVVDIALADPSPVAHQVKVESPLITGITLDRHETASIPLTRVTISLTQDAYLAVRSTPEDKGRLLVTLVKKIAAAPETAAKDNLEKDLEQTDQQSGEPAAPTPTKTTKGDDLDDLTAESATASNISAEKPAETVTAPVPTVTATAAVPAPASAGTGDLKVPNGDDQKPDSMAPTVQVMKTALKPVVAGAGITTSSSPVTITTTGVHLSGLAQAKNPRIFRLAGPNRLVIDIPGNKGLFQQSEIPCNRFGINKIRVGVYPNKVRVVFDSGQSPIPNYRIEKFQSDLLVSFGKK